MRGNNNLLGVLLIVAVLCTAAVSQVAAQGLAFVPPGISWPWKQSNASELYKDEPFLKGDAGFNRAAKYDSSTYFWLTQEWVGVVRDTNPENVEALHQILDYNLDILGPAAAPRIFTGIDFDYSNATAYFCTYAGSDVWRYQINSGELRKIYDRPTRTPNWNALMFEPSQSLVWLIADTAVAWINTALDSSVLYSPNPPTDPSASSGGVSDQLPYSALQTISQIEMKCITRDYKARNGKQTPFVYIGANAQIIRTEVQNHPFRTAGFRRLDFEVRSIGAGTYNVIGVNSNRDSLYLGSSLGLGIEVDLDTFTLKRLFFAPGDQFLSLLIDGDVSYWGTLESTVYRVNGKDFTIFASTTVPRGDLRSVVDDGRFLHFGSARAGVTGREFFTFTIRKTDCSVYSCDECFRADQEYCGVCKSTGSCTLNRDCSGEWQTQGLCPASFVVSPSSASILGNSEITITGAFFESSGHECIFNYNVPGNAEATAKNITVPARVLTTTTLVCTAPAYPAAVAPTSTKSVQIGVRWTGPAGPRAWGGYLPFTYYSCGSLSCGDCFSGQFLDCGWCLGTGKCSSLGECPVADRFTKSGCPTVLSVTPSTGPIDGGETVTVTVSNIIDTDTYKCKFGDAALVPATVVGPNSLSCTAPAIVNDNGQGNQDVQVSVYLIDPANVNNPILHTPRVGTFTYYNCSVFSRCDLCVNATTQPRCTWCSSPTLRCGKDDSNFCNAPATTTTSCPAIQLLRPNSDFVPTAPILYQPIPITLVGANFQPIPNMQCVFKRPTGGFAITAASLPAGTNDIVCSTPNTGADPYPAEYQLYLAGGNPIVQQTASVPFLFYDCNGGSCADCIEPRKRLCRWCPYVDIANPTSADQQFCATVGTRSCPPTGDFLPNYLSCPILRAVSPDGDAVEGGSFITLSGEFNFLVDDSIVYECEWRLVDGSRVRAPATINPSTNTATCSARAVSSTQTAQIRLVRNGVGYTNSLNFRYYNCSTLSTCSGCLNRQLYPSCTWCATKCSSKAVCSLPKQVNTGCPRILRATPDHADISGGDPITLEGGPFVSSDSTGSFECVWNNVLHLDGLFLDSSRVQCTSPRQSVSNATLTLYYAGVPYTPDSVNIEFFSCSPPPPSTFCTDLCTAQKHCGWCLSSQSCGSEAKCKDSLWLAQCLKPQLNQDHSNLEGQEVIKTYLPGTELSGVLPDELKCYFGSGSAPVDVNITVGAQHANVSCEAPPSATPDEFFFRILYNNQRLFDESQTRFYYVNCKAITRCEDCAISPNENCGWCGDTNTCTTAEFCPLGNWTTGAGTCPEITDVKPREGDVSGGTNVTISGQRFLRSENIDLYWDDVKLDRASWRVINPSVIIATSPSSNKADTAVKIELRFGENATLYAVRPGQFTYIDPRAATIKTAVGAAAGVVGAILIGIAIFFWYKKKYSGGMIVIVKEPDYVLVAYGSDLEQKYRLPEDNYIKLETALMRSDFGFQMGISSICPSTEQDAIAKSLVHIAYCHNDPTFVIDMINEAVRAEVAGCIQENTIFRGNSIASKMFKFYSRMVGIRYLWRFIARVIAEIETLGRKELNEKLRAEKGEKKKDKEASLLDISMELDEAKMGRGDTDVDLDTNILQLKLTCQKLFSVIVKNSLKEFPTEFRQIFVNIDQCVMGKFKSDDATYKAIGGFFFLRFVCPAITAPHVYGLLDTPPNTLTQRQLVLISKVLQSLANMALPGKKEKYMTKLLDFIESGIPKMGKFYDEIRKHTAFVEGAEYEYTDIGMPPTVKNNALGTVWNFIYLNQDKTAQSFSQIGVDKGVQREIQDALEEMIYTYKSAPRKYVAKKAKKTKTAAAADE